MHVHPVVDQLLGADAIQASGIVWDAVRLARVVQRDGRLGAFAKTDASPVTIADLAVQALVADRLGRLFPGDGLVAEEDEAVLSASLTPRRQMLIAELVARVVPRSTPGEVGWAVKRSEHGPRVWVLDPIDGTRGLLGGRQYVVSLALIADGRVSVGLVGCPGYAPFNGMPATQMDQSPGAGGVAVAVRGRGAWWMSPDGRDIRRLVVSSALGLSKARVLTSYEHRHDNQGHLARTLVTLGIRQPPIRLDSQAKHVVLAAGRAEVLLRFPTADHAHEKIWDQAAGALTITEAGGRITDLAGRPLDFSTGRQLSHNQGILASNGELHEAVLDAIRPMLDQAPATEEPCAPGYV